jgi:hypothetical protein
MEWMMAVMNNAALVIRRCSGKLEYAFCLKQREKP